MSIHISAVTELLKAFKRQQAICSICLTCVALIRERHAYLSTACHELLRQLSIRHFQKALEQDANWNKELLPTDSEGKVGGAVSEVMTPHSC